MTDLIKRDDALAAIQEYAVQEVGAFRTPNLKGAADRIEALTKERDTAREYAGEVRIREKVAEDVRIEAEAKLAAIDDLMVRRIKHHQEMKDLKGFGAAQKREHYKLHALSEALGEIRKVTKGKNHD